MPDRESRVNKENKKAKEEELHNAEQARAADGDESLQRLSKVKIGKSDRQLIARALYKYVERVFEIHPEWLRQDLALKARLSGGGENAGKEISRLTLPPGEVTVARLRDLRAGGRDYAKLIKAVAKALGRNVNHLTDDITFGTAVHPVNLLDKDIDPGLLAGIQFVAKEVDKNTGLLDKFIKIGNKKCELLLKGGLCDWPFYNLDKPLRENDEEGPVDRDATDPRYSYWMNSDVTEVDGRSIAQLPHVHLGMFWADENGDPGEYWDGIWGCDNYTPESIEALERFKEECGDFSNDQLVDKKRKEYFDTGLFKGKTLFDAVPRKVEIDNENQIPVYRDEYGLMANLDYWLVLYPNREMTALEPILWSHGGDFTYGMMSMQSLTLRVLNEMRQIPVISPRNETLYDRLKSLLVYESETEVKNPLFKQWEETAHYVEACPIWADVKHDDEVKNSLKRLLKGVQNNADE